ncbi:MAG: YihY/virulence factor BrkB family protein [Coleofasciculaceae cyanobacterium]
MLLAGLFHILQHLNLARIRQFWHHSKIRWLLVLASKVIRKFWRIFSQAILFVVRDILKRVVRFVTFFRYLNWKTLKEVFDRATEQRLAGLSAEMAYNATLSLFPGLLAILAAISVFGSLQSTLYDMARIVGEIAPQQVQTTIGSLIRQIISSRNGELLSLSFIFSLWTFSGVIGAAMAALDQIHRVPRKKSRPYWKAKLVSLGLAIGTLGLLIIASALVLVSNQIVEILAINSCFLETVPDCPPDKILSCLLNPPAPVQDCLLRSKLLEVWKYLKWPMTLCIVSTAFAFVYRFGPTRRQRGTPLVPGAIVAAIMWALLSSLFRLYVANFGKYNLTYGTIGTFVILMLWFYLSSLVMLIGAQLNVTVGKVMRRNRD